MTYRTEVWQVWVLLQNIHWIYADSNADIGDKETFFGKHRRNQGWLQKAQMPKLKTTWQSLGDQIHRKYSCTKSKIKTKITVCTFLLTLIYKKCLFQHKKLCDYTHTKTDICISVCIHKNILIIYILFLSKTTALTSTQILPYFFFQSQRQKKCVKLTVRDTFKPK